MSAYQVDDAHINALVTAAIFGPLEQRGHLRMNFTGRPFPFETIAEWEEWRIACDEDGADEVGQLLKDANIASVRFRYDDADEAGMIDETPFAYRVTGARLRAIEVLKAIAGYEYQSCEYHEWHTSSARQFCSTLREYVILALPGYAEAQTWCIGRTPR